MFDDSAQNNRLAWNGKAIALLDLDAFFASVEQLDHPEWRGLPVIVGGSADKRGVVSTASYEARAFGVHSAMPSATARRLCPQAIWTNGNFARYREMSAKVMGFLTDETPLVEQVSIDEAFFDISPGRFTREEPFQTCARIQERVSELGITCSIGLGTSKTIAKIASEREKPRGLTVVFPGTEQSFLAPLPVKAMSGIGPAAEKALATYGIKTLGQLARASQSQLAAVFGSNAERMRLRALGQEQSVVASAYEEEDPKSVSNERTFERDLFDRAEIEAAILHIAAMTGRRLRRKGLKGRTVTLKIKHTATSQQTAQTALASPTDNEHVFGRAALELLDRIWSQGEPVRLIGVGVSHFDDGPITPTLFDADAKDYSSLSQATDTVRERFGENAIGYGRDLRFRESFSNTAPTGKADA